MALRLCESCGRPLQFTYMMKTNGERELACLDCGFKKWFEKNDLSLEENNEINSLIEARRNSKNVVYYPKAKTPVTKIISNAKNEPKIKRLTKTEYKPQKPIVKPVVKSPLEINLQTKVVNIFKNVLRSHLDKYVERPAQINLAIMIGSSFINNNICLAEAGVGTGKSFAYLVPVSQHFSQGPIVISTKTIPWLNTCPVRPGGIKGKALGLH